MKYKRLTLLSIIFAILLTPGNIPTSQAQVPSVDLSSVQSLDDLTASSPGIFVPGQNVDTNLLGFEPHVAVNPLNSANVAVAQGNQVKLSINAGQTFPITVNAQIPATLAGLGYGFFGDPVLTFDSQGRFFFSYLVGVPDPLRPGFLLDLSVAVLQVNPITGATIGPAVDVTPGNTVDDKNWIAADKNPLSPFADNLYMVWANFTPSNVGPVSVMFSMSTNQGVTWTVPSTISILFVEGFTWPPHITVAPNGDVFANYPTTTCQPTGTVQVLRDTNGGADLAGGVLMNLFQKTTAFTANQAQMTCNRQDRLGQIPNTDFWLQGTAAAYTLTDPNTPGRIYVIGNDDPNNNFGVGDDGDVVMVTSTDSGMNWGAPVTISHGPGTSLQVMPTGAIDPQGNIMVSWYDTRAGATNAGGNLLLDVFTTISRDGGVTFSNPDFQVNDNPFDPDLNAPIRFPPDLPNFPAATLRIGEYNGIDAASCVASLAWTGNNALPIGNGLQDIFFDTLTCPVVCGDGIVDPPEQCDDLNLPTLTCDINCMTIVAPFCGDGVVNQPSEQCDDLNLPTPTCDINCQNIVAPFCGDGVVNQPSEQCDDLNLPTPTCDINCQNIVVAPFCGDGVVNQPSEQCDDLNLPTPTCDINCGNIVAVCGDGKVEGNEQCDDLNLPTSTCDINCRLIFVGGEFLGVDSTALLLAGFQANALWLLPLFAAIGIAAVVIRRIH